MSDWHNIPNVRDRLTWREDKGRMKLNYFLSIIMIGMVLNGYDGTIISGLQAFDSWNADLGYPNGTKIGLLNACSQFSGLVVGPIIQYIDDTFGRKWGIRFYSYTLLAGSVIGCVAGVAGANGYALFVCGRVLIGFGLTSFLMTSLAIVQEITHPRTRSLVAHSWDSYWILGAVIASWVNFGCSYMTSSWQWRLPYIIQVVPAVYLLIAVQFVPETPRFMIGKGREEDALHFLVEYHGNGDAQDPLVLFEFEEMKEAINREKAAKAEKWSQILKYRANLHRLGLAALMMFCTSLSGSSIIYYYYSVVFDLVGITGATTQTGIAAGLNMFTWLCQIAAVFVGKRVGRRTIMLTIWPMLLLGLIGLCVSTAAFTHSAEGNKSAGVACVVMVWIYLGCFNASNPVLYSYPSEVQTFSMRSKGLLVWNTCSQLFGAYTTWVDSIALRKIGYKYYIVYMPLVVLQWFLVYFFMVETKGYTLEEIAIAFDGSQVNLISPDAYTVEHSPVQGDHMSTASADKAREPNDVKAM
ncbi:putative hexose transport-related protein [Papiliotrema laurentii]|uniref:Hexose transport-related protein n=1 Tax=Papiliotrema laurentii TaxID=5418 RepID=A0AAD9FSF8_PAPLA|nr:putative hexose transport-related protein [Papiliotrema laurentii]